MISASHNPYQDNGIKVFDHSGYKLPDEAEHSTIWPTLRPFSRAAEACERRVFVLL